MTPLRLVVIKMAFVARLLSLPTDLLIEVSYRCMSAYQSFVCCPGVCSGLKGALAHEGCPVTRARRCLRGRNCLMINWHTLRSRHGVGCCLDVDGENRKAEPDLGRVLSSPPPPSSSSCSCLSLPSFTPFLHPSLPNLA